MSTVSGNTKSNDWKPPRGHYESLVDKPPSAGWMDAAGVRGNPYETGSILLGENGGEWVGSTDDRHLLTVAGSRAGKSSTCLKPNLYLWPSSVVCLDPKGELASETAAHREAMGQDVYILDPFGEVEGAAAKYRAWFNPLSEIGQGGDAIDDCAMIAEAMILSDKGGDHWSISAKNAIRGLLLYVLLKDRENGSLIDMREILTSPLEAEKSSQRMPLKSHFQVMLEDEEAFGGVVAGVGGTMLGKPDGERGSILSTAIEQTAFLDSEKMQDQLTGSDGLRPLPSLRNLKRKPTTIYLVLPASRMATHFRWFRLILTLALTALEREPMALPHPVLFILEEFPQLGYMRQIEAAAGLMAGYGVKLWTILQDLSQLKSLYKDSWETFIGNAGIVQAFGNTDATTLEYISRALGSYEIIQKRGMGAVPTSSEKGQLGSQDQTKSVPLLAPFEIAQYCARETGKQIILKAGSKPAYIGRLSHKDVAGLVND